MVHIGVAGANCP